MRVLEALAGASDGRPLSVCWASTGAGPARYSESVTPGNLLYGMDYARPGGVGWGVSWASVGR